MHGTLVYPLAGRLRSARPKGAFQRTPNIPKLPPDLRKRISMWKRIVLGALLRRAGFRLW